MKLSELKKNTFLQHILYDNYSTFEKGSNYIDIYKDLIKSVFNDEKIIEIFEDIESGVFEQYKTILYKNV